MKSLFYILFIVSYIPVFGQDLHSSNIQYLSTIYNPALTALKNETEANLTHRSQWRKVGSNFKSNTVSFNTTLMPNRRKNQGYLALGFNGYNEQMNKTASISSFSINTAYHLFISEQMRLSTGINVGYYGLKLDPLKGSWASQHNGLFYDENLASGEEFLTYRQSKLDVGAGLVYTILSYDKKVNLFQIGGAAFHVNQPKISFLTAADTKLPVRFVGFSSVAIPLFKEGSYIEASVLYQNQRMFNALTFGAMAKIKLIEKAKFTSSNSKLNEVFAGVGVYIRNKDALIVNMMLQKSNWTAALAYDFNTSGLKNSNNNNGAIELKFSYTIPSFGVNSRY